MWKIILRRARLHYNNNRDIIFLSGGFLGSGVGFYCGSKSYYSELKKCNNPAYDRSLFKYITFSTFGAAMGFIPGLFITPLLPYLIPIWTACYFIHKKMLNMTNEMIN